MKKYFLIVSSITIGIFIIGRIIWLKSASEFFRDFGINLSAGAIGSVITFILFDLLWDREAKRKWIVVKKEVMNLLNKLIYSLFIDLFLLVDVQRTVFDSNEDINEAFYKKEIDNLKRLVKSKDIKLRKSYKKDLLEGNFGELFEHRRQLLSDFELKYSKFLEPEIIKSLIIIQKNLYSIDLNIKLAVKNKKNKDFFTKFILGNKSHFERILKIKIHNILKEIYNLYEMGIYLKFGDQL